MANVENLEKRLLKLINKQDSFAVALTGDWGIGKTSFWKEFYQKYHSELEVNKCAEVSLFGIDSIEALKFEIALSTHETTQKKDYLSGLKNIFKKSLDAIDLPKIGDAGVTLSIGKGMISSTLSSLISDTLICIDDMERRSDKLDIKDVMGLVNYLNLEKKCKVFVILDEDKAGNKFKEYKEKVFDEVLILDDSLSIIRDSIVKDDTLYPIYEKFYQTIGVKNLRFYKRVKKTLEWIIDNAFTPLSLASKKQLLESLLVIRLAHDMPEFLGKDFDFSFFVDKFSKDKVDDFRYFKTYNSYQAPEYIYDDRITKHDLELFEKVDAIISRFFSSFAICDWSKLIVDVLTDLHLDDLLIEKLKQLDEINESKLKSDRDIALLKSEYHSLDPLENFNRRLFNVAVNRIEHDHTNSLSLYCNILRMNHAIELSEIIERKTKVFISSKINEDPKYREISYWYYPKPQPHNIFSSFIEESIIKYEKNLSHTIDTGQLIKLFEDNHYGREIDKCYYEAISKINKPQLQKLIWHPLFNEVNRKNHIKSIINHPAFVKPLLALDDEIDIKNMSWQLPDKNIDIMEIYNLNYVSKSDIIRKWILELLQEKIKENPASKAPIEMWLDDTENLTKI